MSLYEFVKSIVLIVIFIALFPFLIKSIKSQYCYFLEPYTYIGVLSLKGPISDSSSYTKHLQSFFKDPLIKGIIVKIDSSECAAGTSNIIFNEIQQYKKEYPKPIITLIENTCIAGAYLIASATDYIIAPESALVGGIGAFNYSIKKDSNDTFYNEMYQQFTKNVATARKLSLATVSNWANEKVFTGKQAYSFGLINAIGSMHTAIALLKEKALIDGEIEWIEKEEIKAHRSLPHFLHKLYNTATTQNLKEA